MTLEAEKLLAAAIEMVGLRGSFDPAEVGETVGLSRMQSEAAVRALSNDGVVELGFDMAAHFTPGYRKFLNPNEGKPVKVAKAKAAPKVKAAANPDKPARKKKTAS